MNLYNIDKTKNKLLEQLEKLLSGKDNFKERYLKIFEMNLEIVVSTFALLIIVSERNAINFASNHPRTRIKIANTKSIHTEIITS